MFAFDAQVPNPAALIACDRQTISTAVEKLHKKIKAEGQVIL